ncbi:hypothetical protein E2C01_026740 [Portunus trituberculatus]|uniref:Uncharacterized protein n=1 Tax=Portunus trituberculatus TaxID=210409 RepID=A0A5B7EG40_PORTR|nr:hypothetical protein [Portunus trituberculatus]
MIIFPSSLFRPLSYPYRQRAIYGVKITSDVTVNKRTAREKFSLVSGAGRVDLRGSREESEKVKRKRKEEREAAYVTLHFIAALTPLLSVSSEAVSGGGYFPRLAAEGRWVPCEYHVHE